jgi:hypothetical protein
MRRLRWLVLSGILVATLGASAPASAPASSASLSACGTVTSNTTLYADCIGPLTVAGSGIIVNLGGHTISCQGNASLTGIILANVTHDLIVGGNDGDPSVTDCGTGILISGGGSHTLKYLTVTGNLSNGIDLENTSHNWIESSSSSNNNGLGVLINGSDYNKLSKMCISENDGPLTVGGIFITPTSSYNKVEYVTLTANGEWGIRVDGGSNTISHTNITKTFTSGAPTDGIIIQGDGNTISYNVSNENLSGIDLRCGRTNLIIGNVANNNTQFGIVSHDHDIPTQFQCVAPFFPEHNTFTKNWAFGNGYPDLADYHFECTTNTWASNAFGTSDPDCIGADGGAGKPYFPPAKGIDLCKKLCVKTTTTYYYKDYSYYKNKHGNYVKYGKYNPFSYTYRGKWGSYTYTFRTYQNYGGTVCQYKNGYYGHTTDQDCEYYYVFDTNTSWWW